MRIFFSFDFFFLFIGLVSLVKIGVYNAVVYVCVFVITIIMT